LPEATADRPSAVVETGMTSTDRHRCHRGRHRSLGEIGRDPVPTQIIRARDQEAVLASDDHDRQIEIGRGEAEAAFQRDVARGCRRQQVDLAVHGAFTVSCQSEVVTVSVRSPSAGGLAQVVDGQSFGFAVPADLRDGRR
jgi:hypothetical protein